MSRGSAWLQLITSLPTENATERMRVWRALKATGAGVLRDGVYVLPERPDLQELFTGLATEITEAGGSAHVLRVEPRDEAQAEALRALVDRTKDYATLVDEISRAGLDGLSQVLRNRTAVEAGEPRGINLALDDLNLFPLLYWPVPANHPDLASGVTDRVGDYLHHGGLILFDTGDAGMMIPGQAGPGPGERRLRQLLNGLSLPPLVPVPEDHTLTRSFYLLQDFPGRWTGETTWVDQADESVNDGVSSVIIGGNDWAGAWAVDEYGRTLLPVLPGGERQREMARRFGVNLVMYALTGNYKTDQVHVPAILERLGQ